MTIAGPDSAAVPASPPTCGVRGCGVHGAWRCAGDRADSSASPGCTRSRRRRSRTDPQRGRRHRLARPRPASCARHRTIIEAVASACDQAGIGAGRGTPCARPVAASMHGDPVAGRLGVGRVPQPAVPEGHGDHAEPGRGRLLIGPGRARPAAHTRRPKLLHDWGRSTSW